MRTPALARRDTLRLALLAVALGGGGSLWSACAGRSGGGGPDPDPGADGIELVSSEVKRAAGDTTVLPDVVAGLQELAGDLYGELSRTKGNLVLSPYSILVALGMTLTGAGGRTAEEMRAVLRVDDVGADRWHKGVNALMAHVGSLAGEQERTDGSKAELALATANQLFGQTGVRWEDEFLDLLAKEYGAGLRAVDFETAVEDARRLVNDWVEEQTEDRIKDLVPEGVLDAATRLVLVNAIYLKAPWEHPFTKELTQPDAFTLADGSRVEAETMRRPDVSGGLVTGEGWRAAVLPYAGQRLAMTVVLPDGGDLGVVERVVADDGLAAVLTGAQPVVLDLSLPRWSYRTAVPLKKPLKRLGMPTAFEDADFTPMTEEDLDLVVEEVLHQGFIAVDEEGTEAAAATAVVMRETSAPVSVPFAVDRPFLYVIHDVEHGTPLFVGRVSDPTA